MNRFGLDIVSGVVIGDFLKSGGLFYEGRQQGQRFHADDDEGLRVIARKMKGDYVRSSPSVYPADAWELRIYD
jgi:hypothetical protein